MNHSPETRLFRQFWQDGALDLVAGGAVLLIGIGYLLERMLVPAIVVPIAFAAWFILRRHVVGPRAGYVAFALRRRQQSGRELRGAAAIGLSVLALIVALGFGARRGVPALQHVVDAVPALLIALAAVMAAGLTRTWRFAVYAALIAVAGSAAVVLKTGPAMPLLVGGFVVFGTGAILFMRFLAESRRFEAEA